MAAKQDAVEEGAPALPHAEGDAESVFSDSEEEGELPVGRRDVASDADDDDEEGAAGEHRRTLGEATGAANYLDISAIVEECQCLLCFRGNNATWQQHLFLALARPNACPSSPTCCTSKPYGFGLGEAASLQTLLHQYQYTSLSRYT